MNTTTSKPPTWIGWWRERRKAWRKVAEARTSAEAQRLVDEHLAELPDCPRHVEVYTGLKGNAPPA